MRKSNDRFAAFTLVELLVVIAIVSIIAAMIFPAMAKAHEKGRQAACLGNEQQIGLALLMYAQDYNDCLPVRSFQLDPDPGLRNVTSWKAEIFPYVRTLGIYTCPTDPSGRRGDFNSGAHVPGQPSFSGSYAVNRRYGPGVNSPFVDDDQQVTASMVRITAPSQVIAVVESTSVFTDFDVASTDFFEHAMFAGHLGRGNVLFLDGHVKAMRPLDTLDLADGGAGSVNLWTIDNTRFDNSDATAALEVLSSSQRQYE